MGAQLEQGHWPAAAAHGDPLAIESKDFKSLAVTKRQNIYIYFHCREIKVVFTYFFSSFKTHCVVGSWTELITSMRRWGTRLPKDQTRRSGHSSRCLCRTRTYTKPTPAARIAQFLLVATADSRVIVLLSEFSS